QYSACTGIPVVLMSNTSPKVIAVNCLVKDMGCKDTEKVDELGVDEWRMSSCTPKGANVQWTFGERTERPCARLQKCPITHQHNVDIR
nr:hypothetical protein [Saprospiraceae bacterium]